MEDVVKTMYFSRASGRNSIVQHQPKEDKPVVKDSGSVRLGSMDNQSSNVTASILLNESVSSSQSFKVFERCEILPTGCTRFAARNEYLMERRLSELPDVAGESYSVVDAWMRLHSAVTDDVANHVSLKRTNGNISVHDTSSKEIMDMVPRDQLETSQPDEGRDREGLAVPDIDAQVGSTLSKSMKDIGLMEADSVVHKGFAGSKSFGSVGGARRKVLSEMAPLDFDANDIPKMAAEALMVKNPFVNSKDTESPEKIGEKLPFVESKLSMKNPFVNSKDTESPEKSGEKLPFAESNLFMRNPFVNSKDTESPEKSGEKLPFAESKLSMKNPFVNSNDTESPEKSREKLPFAESNLFMKNGSTCDIGQDDTEGKPNMDSTESSINLQESNNDLGNSSSCCEPEKSSSSIPHLGILSGTEQLFAIQNSQIKSKLSRILKSRNALLEAPLSTDKNAANVCDEDWNIHSAMSSGNSVSKETEMFESAEKMEFRVRKLTEVLAAKNPFIVQQNAKDHIKSNEMIKKPEIPVMGDTVEEDLEWDINESVISQTKVSEKATFTPEDDDWEGNHIVRGKLCEENSCSVVRKSKGERSNRDVKTGSKVNVMKYRRGANSASNPFYLGQKKKPEEAMIPPSRKPRFSDTFERPLKPTSTKGYESDYIQRLLQHERQAVFEEEVWE